MASKKTKSKEVSKAAARDGRTATAVRTRSRGRRRLPPITVMPTLFTLGNLIAGFAAVYYASKPIDYSGLLQWSSLTLAGALIFLGMFFDAVDGSVARLTRSSSEIGAQLDSLADMVTFGVAPAFMMLRLVSNYVGSEGTVHILGPMADNTFAKVLWGVAAAYVACTALRLARFNVETPTASVEDHMIFRGLPSPGAAGTVASLIVLHQHYLAAGVAGADEISLAFARWTAFGVPLITLLCACAMVSSIPYIHFVNRYVRGQRNFGYVAGIVIIIVVSAPWFQEVLAVAFTVFALSGPMRLLINHLRRRRMKKSATES
ncbi:MAG: CDP-alcohol phosphatidyltransferase family protein [Planctomycetes bacterium]|nr:CDP-alcohol phosphatidyltransferase family protein [Planctomycetota bacterium]